MNSEYPSNEDLLDACRSNRLVQVLEKIRLERLGEVGEALATIHQSRIVDVAGTLINLKWSELRYGELLVIAHTFRGFMPTSSFPPAEFISLVHEMHLRLGKIHEHTLYKGFKDWATKHPSGARAIAERLAEQTDESPYFGLALEGWRQYDQQGALGLALLATEDQRPMIRRQAILALAGFVAASDDVRRSAARRLSALIMAGDLEARRAAIISGTSMLSSAPEGIPEIVLALKAAAIDPPREIRFELITGYVRDKKAYPDDLRASVFELMKTVTSEDVETLNLIDMALYDMDPSSQRGSFDDLLISIIRKDDGPSLKSFKSAVHRLQTAGSRTVGWFVTKWLLEGDVAVCCEIHNLFPPLDETLHDFDIDEFKLTEAEVLYLARKAFGYLHFLHGPAVSLLYVCLSALGPASRQALEDHIAAFWLRNYPGDLLHFDSIQATFPREGIDGSISRMREAVESYERTLREMPINRALMPSSGERRTQADLKHSRDGEIMRVAKENSIFGSFVHTTTILYGRSSVTYMYSGEGEEPIRQVIPFGTHEVRTPNPQMDVLSPTRLNFMLFRFRQERRPS
ncbi:hypothetical protein ELH91_10240 [Rhizobium leguminosarum]|uniref:hypothetical protein n=1 Tax=Rhizobium leguminosarum TaxID=384 RepID=UPI001030A958|nr:hypothetical protein [Rhizobium leguminosarum]TAY17119.1 hypothetical protein ELH91_10240 [Rhizobium leguminosarum]